MAQPSETDHPLPSWTACCGVGVACISTAVTSVSSKTSCSAAAAEQPSASDHPVAGHEKVVRVRGRSLERNIWFEARFIVPGSPLVLVVAEVVNLPTRVSSTGIHATRIKSRRSDSVNQCRVA
jgi:hypothetical protein